MVEYAKCRLGDYVGVQLWNTLNGEIKSTGTLTKFNKPDLISSMNFTTVFLFGQAICKESNEAFTH